MSANPLNSTDARPTPLESPLRLAVLGATGQLGRHVCAQAIQRGWDLRVGVRNPDRLDASVRERAAITTLDLLSTTDAAISDWLAHADALVFCAGTVSQGATFCRGLEKVVDAVERLPSDRRPVCWFIAGAALLDLDEKGRRGVDLPKVRDTYWPHHRNHQRLLRSDVDWRLLCPGPMVEQPPLGTARLRVTMDRLPVLLPGFIRSLPGGLALPLFAMKIPEMIIPYADAAAFMLDRLGADDVCSRRRVGLALPVGMKGQKAQWSPVSRD